MPLLIVQQGHCYRTSGATGTNGEQPYATAVAEACVRLLSGKGGWTVRRTLADVNDYRADAFVAIHCDGSTSSSARGASVGYRTPEGQAFGQDWKRAYAARGWPGFRPDNYTAALAGYYGVANAVANGTRRAFIAECGFLTSPEDRALLTTPGGPDRVALAIGDALRIPLGPNSQENSMDLNNPHDTALMGRALALAVGEEVRSFGAGAGEKMTFVVDMKSAAGRTQALIGNLPRVEWGPAAGEENVLHTVLTGLQSDIEEAQQRVDEAAVAAMNAASSTAAMANAVQAMSAKIDQISVGGVDLDVMAQKVVELMDQRARDNDPSTGSPT